MCLSPTFQRTGIVILCIFAIFTWGCNKQKEIKQYNSNIVEIQILISQGDNKDPITGSQTDFVGFPAYYGKDFENNDYLLFGKNIKRNHKIVVNRIACINFKRDTSIYKWNISIPEEKERRTIELKDFEELNMEFHHFKIWIQDWIRYSYADEKVEFISWSKK